MFSRGMTRGTILGRLLLIERRGLDGTLESNATLLEGLDMTAEDDIDIEPRLLGPLEDTAKLATRQIKTYSSRTSEWHYRPRYQQRPVRASR